MERRLFGRIKKHVDARDVHIDVPLSNIAVAYLQDESDFIAGSWFPVVDVGKKSDLYYTWPKHTFFRNRAQKWTPGTNLPQGEIKPAHEGYAADFRAFEWPLAWDTRDNADTQLSLERAGTEFVTRMLLLEREVSVATTYFRPDVWGHQVEGVPAGSAAPPPGSVVQWSDYADSDPEKDVKDMRLAIRRTTGFRANTMVISEEVEETLLLHPKIREIYKFTQTGVLSRELLARVFHVDRILVGGSVQIVSPDGREAEEYDFIYGPHAWIGYVAPRPSLMLPSAGYIFSWNSFTQGFEIGIERVDDRRTKADYMQGITCYDNKLVAADVGGFFENIVSTEL